MPDKTPKYKIGEQEIDARLFKQNLDNNVASYLDAQDWTPAEKELFKQYYNEYSNNLESGRFSTDAFYTITDTNGFLDETKPILFNDDGTQYQAPDFSGETDPEKLKKAQEKQAKYESKLRSFNPSKKVATYAKVIGQELVKALNSPTATAQRSVKFNPKSVATNFEHYRLGAPAKYYNDLRAREAQGNFNRATVLSDYLKKAYEDFQGAGYDESTVSTWTPRFQSAIAALDDGNFGVGDYSTLYPFFENSNFLESYFADKDVTDLTPEQEAALAAQKEAQRLAEAEAAEKETAANQRQETYLSHFNQYKTQYPTIALTAQFDPTKALPDSPEYKDNVSKGFQFFDGKTTEASGINGLLAKLWFNRGSNNEAYLHDLTEDENAAALIRTHTKVPVPHSLNGWYFYAPPYKQWALLYDKVNQKVYRVWAGFFNGSTTYQELSGSLNPSTGKFQEGGELSNNDYALNQLLSSFSIEEPNKTVKKNELTTFGSNYDPEEEFWSADNWARLTQMAADFVSLGTKGWASWGAGATGVVAGLTADLQDYSKGQLGLGSVLANTGLNTLGTIAAGFGIKGSKTSRLGIQFAKMAGPIIKSLATVGGITNLAQLLPTFQKNPDSWDKEDWQNLIWAAQYLLTLKQYGVNTSRMKSLHTQNVKENSIGIRTEGGDYVLTGQAGKEARGIINDSKLSVQAKQEKLTPLLKKEVGFNGLATDIKLAPGKGLKWTNPFAGGNTYLGMELPFRQNQTINTFEPNYEWVMNPHFERKSGNRFEGPEVKTTEPKPQPTSTKPNNSTPQPVQEPELPWEAPVVQPEPTPQPKYPGEIPQVPKLETLLAEPSFTPTRMSGTNLPITAQKARIEEASNNLINIFNNKLGLDEVLNFSYKGRNYSLNKSRVVQSLKDYLAAQKYKPTTNGSKEALIEGWMKYVGLLKTGGAIHKFQAGGTISPELAALALQLKGDGTAPALVPVYNPIDYVHQQQNENRNWVDYNQASKKAWESDAAYKALNNGGSYFDANGNLDKTRTTDFSQALYNTEPYKNFNQYLTTAGTNNNYDNLRGYFQQIYNDARTPQKAKDWVTQWANVDADGKISWKPETLTAIRTQGYKFFDKGNILYPRMDNKPGTYHYTPEMTTPTAGQKVHKFVPNEAGDNWVEVEDVTGYNEYPIENANGVYYMPDDNDSHTNVFYVKGASPASNNPENPTGPNTPTNGSKASIDPLGNGDNNVGNGGDNNAPNTLNNILRTASNLAPHAIAYARLRNLLWNTDQVTNKALAAEIPYLKDPVEKFRDVYGSLEDVNVGQRLFGKYNYAATAHPVTSDVATNQAFQLESWRRGAEEIINGLTKDNAMRRRTHELSIAQDHENVDNRHQVAMENRLQSLKTLKNKSAIEIARLNQIAQDWDVFGQSLEYDFKNRLNERRSLQEGLDMKNAENTVMSNLDKYLAPGSPERQAYDAYLSGAELNDAQRTAYSRAVSAINNAIYSEYARMKGLYYVPKTETKAGFVPKIQVQKIGGTVDFYRYGGHASKERIKNADRFIDSVKHQQKLNWKKLERLSKSMYKLPDKA